jgi:hypothetical protein
VSRFLVRTSIILLLVTLSASALGGEVVRFTEGRYMAVRSHEVQGDRIQLDLGDAQLVVPSYRVAAIRQDRRLVYGTPLRDESLLHGAATPRAEARLARRQSTPVPR